MILVRRLAVQCLLLASRFVLGDGGCRGAKRRRRPTAAKVAGSSAASGPNVEGAADTREACIGALSCFSKYRPLSQSRTIARSRFDRDDEAEGTS